MDDKEYVNNTCSKCLNKYNDKDLCNIVRTIDGSFKCSNEYLGKVGEFVRTDKGFIFQIDKQKRNLDIYFFGDAILGKIKKYSMNDNAISSLIESFTIKLADNRYSAPKSHTLRNIAINADKKLNEGS